MKKFKISALLAILTTVAVFAGCMGQPTPAPAPADAGTSQQPATNNDAGTADTGDLAASADLGALPPLTSDPVNLTFMTWHYPEVAEFVAEQFTVRHPNITIEVLLHPGTYGYMDNLMALAAAGNMPDMWGFLNIAVPANNGWFYDFSEFWFNDPDTDMLLDSLHYHVVIDGRAMRMPEGVLPQLVYLDRNVFELLNEPMPRFDWTWDEMEELIPRMTRPDMNIFGFNMFLGPVTWAPIVLTDGLSEFGWDGENYNMTGAWADALNNLGEWRRRGYQAIGGTDAWEAASGDRYMWPGYSGLVAMQMDAIWTYNNLYSRDWIRERGIDMVPYAIPMGRDARTNRRPAFIDFAGISAATNHPREAYEALKWMTFHTEAWNYRNYITPQLVNEAGEPIHITPNRIPLTNDAQVWADFRTLFPMDEPAWDYFLAASREPVPLGGQGILGFYEWLAEVYHGGEFNGVTNINYAVFEGVINAHDVAVELASAGREFHERALANFRMIYGNPPN